MVDTPLSGNGHDGHAAGLDNQLLVGQLATQAAAMLTRIVERVVSDLSARGELTVDDQRPADELIADAVADRISHFLSPGAADTHTDAGALARDAPDVTPIATAPVGELDGGAPSLDEYEALLDRTSALARALGSCDCWGEQPDCGICHGEGRPGWALPDRQLFDALVRPAVETLRTEREMARQATA